MPPGGFGPTAMNGPRGSWGISSASQSGIGCMGSTFQDSQQWEDYHITHKSKTQSRFPTLEAFFLLPNIFLQNKLSLPLTGSSRS